MKPFPIAFVFLLFAEITLAQSDSAYLDIGRLQLKKEFTQATIIRAADIARAPSLNLSEVIRSWANGALTQKDQMAYVVDGITVADIDAYNIQDIEDITIIRNALGNQNGAGNLQLMALVRTKQWIQGSRHITFSALSTALSRKVTTNTSPYNQQTENVFSGNFQQYTLSARGGNQKINYGGSLGFVHDALPRRNRKDSLYDKQIPEINRVRLNLWGKFTINKNNILSAHFNYTPQVERSHMYEIQRYRNVDDTKKDREYIVNPYIKLETRVSSFFLNKFTFSYLNGRGQDSTNIRRAENNSALIRNIREIDSIRAEAFTFNDNLSFIAKVGKWQVEPSLNINFQKGFFRRATATANSYEQYPLNGSYSWSMQRRYGKLLTATPSLSISYGALFLLQGGVLLDGSKIIDSTYKNTRSYPFINGAVNLARLLKPGHPFDWKIFGSYSERFSGFDGIYQLSDFNHSSVLPSALEPTIYYIGNIYPTVIPPANKLATLWQAGSSLSLLKEKIRINYNYLNTEQRQLTTIILNPWSGFGYRIASGKYLRKQHHFSIEADIFHIDKLTWNSGLFVNMVKNESGFDILTSPDLLVFTEEPRTGGWINRIQYKSFLAGADMVFLLNHEERSMNMGQLSVEKHNTLQLANIFFAYQLNIQRFEGELFISGRNLIDSVTYPVSPNNKKYFGGGFKVSL
ncbi:MAG: hypothetical protein KIT80_03510 [Chitinophagaceae bacterium]|nr:hypothetical protein [Chitinophagaceae bacterium]MCW5925954.1 hypothetical protein [Chitinophagaceae bacterium]